MARNLELETLGPLNLEEYGLEVSRGFRNPIWSIVSVENGRYREEAVSIYIVGKESGGGGSIQVYPSFSELDVKQKALALAVIACEFNEMPLLTVRPGVSEADSTNISGFLREVFYPNDFSLALRSLRNK